MSSRPNRKKTQKTPKRASKRRAQARKARVSERMRIKALRRAVVDAVGYEPYTYAPPTDDLEVLRMRSAFWEHVLAFETAPDTTLRARLAEEGFTPRASSDVCDEELHACLWELIERLADMGTVLSATDHLSDRALYEEIEQQLDEPMRDVRAPGTRHVCDMSESGSPEPDSAYLVYYADDEMRAEWAEHFPEGSIPPRLPLPFDRDRFLPGTGADYQLGNVTESSKRS